ncbi:MAG TPA: CdaR family protein [bacterium]|nr:CdaR family protein [bacterium]HPQ66490.1 CdaR family protein [bacterium]
MIAARDFSAWARHNLWLKIFALAGALVLWYMGSREVYVPETVEVPVELDLPEGYTAVSVTPPAVRVEVEYPKDGEVPDVNSLRVVHTIGSGVEPGVIAFNLTAADIRTPSRVRFTSVSPSGIRVRVDRMTEKVLPVKIVYTGRPRSGYRIEDTSISPSEILVPGPESLLNEMKEIKTRPLSVLGRSVSFGASATLEPLPGYTGKVPLAVNVYTTIGPELKQKRFADIPVRVMMGAGNPEGVILDPDRVTVVLSGRERDIDSAAPGDISAYIEVIGLASGTYELPLKTRLPPGLNLDRAEPRTIRVTTERSAPVPL